VNSGLDPWMLCVDGRRQRKDEGSLFWLANFPVTPKADLSRR